MANNQPESAIILDGNKLTGVKNGDTVQLLSSVKISADETGKLTIDTEKNKVNHIISVNDTVINEIKSNGGSKNTASIGGRTKHKRINKKRGGRTKHKR